ncbi:hypothetical protein Tter_1338 [Thermobaculum terrenum ATCC BAA-798]|uniref:Uncharacterized protein n=1 Tax=Thermobaculum terrenum (strain ATCC BAA-798 / CCMEE 7001 / YNP1) TaxID=525904 RepID=D1CBT0_THET1|nr:hypothetical protein [Thermobaculum terrenum]ACZ42245.1 hypothetical protein Tter_1338 [Thermobaculum terrenum ATCC BAA-798]
MAISEHRESHLETRTIKYRDRDQMSREVHQMSTTGWIVQRVTNLPQGEVEVEFVRSSTVPYLEGSAGPQDVP